jgi:hypothetical protein
MRFPFGNKFPWTVVVELKGEKKVDILYGIPGDMEFESYKEGSEDSTNLTFLVGRKPGSRPLLIAVHPTTLKEIDQEG